MLQQPNPAVRRRRKADAERLRNVDVAKAGREYIAHRRMLGRKRSTLEDYESTLRVHLVAYFGKRPLAAIDIPSVEGFIFDKLDEGKAPKSIRNYLGLLNAIFEHGLRRGWCETNPVAEVEKPRPRSGYDIRFLTREELEAVLAASPDTPTGRLDRLIFLTAALTGMRRGEVVALRWHDVDWQAQVIRVRQSYIRGQFDTPKSRRSSRAVPFAPRLAAELAMHREQTDHADDADLVFAHPELGIVLDPSKLRKRFISCVRRAGVRPVRFHDLRHSFATHMAAAGAPMRALQHWMGHADLRTVQIYTDYGLDPHQGAMYAERAFGVVPPPSPTIGDAP